MDPNGTFQEKDTIPITNTTKPPQKKENVVLDVFRFAFIALLIVIPFRLFVAQPFIVSGASMDPTFETGDYLIIDQLTYEFENPERGDVIIFMFPDDTKKFFIKRVVGLPGEVIEIQNQTVTINTEENTGKFILDEPYIDNRNTRSDFLTVVLDEEEYFVLGDNRRASSDSRAWGPVDKELIVGRALLQLLPVNKINLLPGVFRYDE